MRTLNRYAVRVYDRNVGKQPNDHVLARVNARNHESAVAVVTENVNPMPGDSFYATIENSTDKI